MQTLVNILALSSFAVSAGVVAAGTYVYINKDLIIERVKAQIIEEVMSDIKVPDFIPDIEESTFVDQAVPPVVPGLF